MLICLLMNSDDWYNGLDLRKLVGLAGVYRPSTWVCDTDDRDITKS